ncbi:RNA-directed DNA polymerase, eukaryota, reverse transcriptase zinc-binding domain protein [Tanacetum coccineum]
MLDAYTSTMCQKSWGRNSYARALVEVSSLAALKESLAVAIPFLNGMGHSLETMEVEYEWQPPRCESCKIFDHRDAECPKNVKVVDSTPPVEDEDGFTQVKRKNGKGKQDGKAKHVAGIHLTKPKPKLVYREAQKPPTNHNDKATTSNSDSSVRKDNQPTMQPEDGINIVSLYNSFESLMEKDKVLAMMKLPMRDFNVSLSADEKSTGPSYIDTGMHDFQDCVKAIEVSDVNRTGLRFTWNQNPKGEHGTLKKIDHIMANLDFY